MALDQKEINQLDERCSKEYIEIDGLDEESIDEIEDTDLL